MVNVCKSVYTSHLAVIHQSNNVKSKRWDVFNGMNGVFISAAGTINKCESIYIICIVTNIQSISLKLQILRWIESQKKSHQINIIPIWCCVTWILHCGILQHGEIKVKKNVYAASIIICISFFYLKYSNFIIGKRQMLKYCIIHVTVGPFNQTAYGWRQFHVCINHKFEFWVDLERKWLWSDFQHQFNIRFRSFFWFGTDAADPFAATINLFERYCLHDLIPLSLKQFSFTDCSFSPFNCTWVRSTWNGPVNMFEILPTKSDFRQVISGDFRSQFIYPTHIPADFYCEH